MDQSAEFSQPSHRQQAGLTGAMVTWQPVTPFTTMDVEGEILLLSSHVAPPGWLTVCECVCSGLSV